MAKPATTPVNETGAGAGFVGVTDNEIISSGTNLDLPQPHSTRHVATDYGT